MRTVPVLMMLGLGVPFSARGAPPDAFQRTFEALSASTSTVFVVTPRAPAPVPSRSGWVDASAPTRALHVPPILDRGDLDLTVAAHLDVLRTCYAEERAVRPRWQGPVILDLIVRRSGRVAEVSVRPAELTERPVGRCLQARVARWRFPAFTGETEPGLTREAITASFPLLFRP